MIQLYMYMLEVKAQLSMVVGMVEEVVVVCHLEVEVEEQVI